MKLLIVTCLDADRHTVSKLLQSVGVNIFSVSETTGYKRNNGQPNLLDNWFGNHNTEFESAFFFSFTDDKKAQDAVAVIDHINSDSPDRLPIHAFVMNVESHTASSI